MLDRDAIFDRIRAAGGGLELLFNEDELPALRSLAVPDQLRDALLRYNPYSTSALRVRIVPGRQPVKEHSMPQSQAVLDTALRAAGGPVTSTDPLVSFVYELLRDHLPAGTVEGVLRNCLSEATQREFTNGHLANYAQSVVLRLAQARVPPTTPPANPGSMHIAAEKLAALGMKLALSFDREEHIDGSLTAEAWQTLLQALGLSNSDSDPPARYLALTEPQHTACCDCLIALLSEHPDGSGFDCVKIRSVFHEEFPFRPGQTL